MGRIRNKMGEQVIKAYFEPTIPIRNSELYGLVERVTIRDLREEELGYIGTDKNHRIVLTSEVFKSTIKISQSNNSPPILIESYDSADRKTASNCLSKLLRMELRDVSLEQAEENKEDKD
ncbi:MAG: hypothetical protein V1740_02220 [Candidatus Woesearchaeota archaeon]